MINSLIKALFPTIIEGILLFIAGCAPHLYPPTIQSNSSVCICRPECQTKLAVGHRGTGSLNMLAPENTLAAFRLAWKMGADLIEIDVRDTADGVPVVIHDRTVDRTTNGSGAVAQMTLAEIKALEITVPEHFKPRQRVPTFREALACLKTKTLVTVDIKSCRISRMVKIIAEEQMLDSVFLLIGTINEGIEAREVYSSVHLIPRVHRIAEVTAFYERLKPICAVEVAYDEAVAPLVTQIHSKGIKILTDALGPMEFIDPLRYQRILNRGADIIQTDRLNALVPLLKERQQQI